MKTCEEYELALLGGQRTADVNDHLAGCPACQAFERDLGLVVARSSLPAPTDAERAALEGLVESTWSEWQRSARPRRSWVGYAAAAGSGALLATAGFWTTRPVREVVVERVVERPVVVASAAGAENEPNLTADEVFFEVMWPDLPEGETP
ncbi:MAG: hypothetical protein JNJ54_13245 [Myxococcaceae bacterium]|nr:hypothetical protein [Myxococcaceae bacterium]